MNDKDNFFGSKPTLLMIDLNDIISILKGDDTIDDNINILLKLTILDISNDTWITLVCLMNTLFAL
jgi:hypothetical protein